MQKQPHPARASGPLRLGMIGVMVLLGLTVVGLRTPERPRLLAQDATPSPVVQQDADAGDERGDGLGDTKAQAIPLTEENRTEALASLRKYQEMFVKNRVDCELDGWSESRGNRRPFELTIKLSDQLNYWSITREITVADPFSGNAAPQAEEKLAVIDIQYDITLAEGVDVLTDINGNVVQVRKFCTPPGMPNIIGGIFFNAIGWKHYREQRVPRPKVILGALPDVERRRTETGWDQVERRRSENGWQIVATRRNTEQSYSEMTFTDLPDVRFTGTALYSQGKRRSFSAIEYQPDRNGVMLPRTIRRSMELPDPQVKGNVYTLIEEGVFQNFVLTPLATADPVARIEIPAGIRVIDDCRKIEK